jgi:hypothetical protein
VARSPEERREMIRREAKKLAEDQGLDWKTLPRERRREFRQQVRTARRGSGKDQTAK